MGKRLYAALFGALTVREAAHPAWLLSLDDALFQLPFAALVTEGSGKMKYLVEQHSLQVVPGALSLIGNLTGASRGFRGVADGQTGQKSQADWFLGLGDPIYNTADPRWGAVHPARERFKGWFAYGAVDGAGQLSRLVGSANEVESSARNWTAGAGTASLLMGREAQREGFLKLIAGRPAIIHLATHVLTPETTFGAPWPSGPNAPPTASDTQVPSDRQVMGLRSLGATRAGPSGRREALIAFGLGPSGQPEALSTSEIGTLDVPGAVVSMTGCDSGEGDIQAGAGLLGLTRAWQIAGARAVIATGWPVNDTNGELFAAFYRYLRSGSPAEALRRSQVQMIHSGTWRSSPAYWASYQVTGGAR
jgi:CHAT domain-containing protein